MMKCYPFKLKIKILWIGWTPGRLQGHRETLLDSWWTSWSAPGRILSSAPSWVPSKSREVSKEMWINMSGICWLPAGLQGGPRAKYFHTERVDIQKAGPPGPPYERGPGLNWLHLPASHLLARHHLPGHREKSPPACHYVTMSGLQSPICPLRGLNWCSEAVRLGTWIGRDTRKAQFSGSDWCGSSHDSYEHPDKSFQLHDVTKLYLASMRASCSPSPSLARTGATSRHTCV